MSVSSRLRACLPRRRPTLLLRCVLLVSCELLVNALLWIVAAIVFRRRTRFLTLSLLAWTLGLRHALDADHISVIDNATRRIVSLYHPTMPNQPARPRRPVTCGLWFSLGHSTIVVAVISAIAISLGIVDRLGKISTAGGIIGAAVSGSTLFLFAIVNSILLYQSVRATRRHRSSSPPLDQTVVGNEDKEKEGKEDKGDHRFRGVFTRLAYPLFRLVDRPYKLYPIGVLFGLGFDTASSIALLGIAGATNTQVQDTSLESDTAILPQSSTTRSDASIVLLALLFTAGMTLVDSLDSVLMINAYAPGELLAPSPAHAPWWKRIRFFEPSPSSTPQQHLPTPATHLPALQHKPDEEEGQGEAEAEAEAKDGEKEDGKVAFEPSGGDGERVRQSSTSSSLSHLLTLLSIVLAFAISVITLVGLIGENCDRCARAAEKQADTGNAGLEGRWWLFWQQANDASGIIGACIVGGFAAILILWYTVKSVLTRTRTRNTTAKST